MTRTMPSSTVNPTATTWMQPSRPIVERVARWYPETNRCPSSVRESIDAMCPSCSPGSRRGRDPSAGSWKPVGYRLSDPPDREAAEFGDQVDIEFVHDIGDAHRADAG